MKKWLPLVALLAVGLSGIAAAHETSTDIYIGLEEGGWIIHDGQGGNDILLIETTTTALGAALTALGHTYDYFSGSDFSGLDLSPYDHVFLGMDGGLVEGPSIQNLANFINAGGCGHIFGGTCWQPYAIAMNTYILENDINNYCWVQNAIPPDSRVVDAAHYLASGLPANYNYLNNAASYYQLRNTDVLAWVAAENGDGYDHLLSKDLGSGNFDICINSSYSGYWAGADFDWMTQVVANMLNGCGVTPTTESSWGAIKSLYR
jgi:hypothetical protein